MDKYTLILYWVIKSMRAFHQFVKRVHIKKWWPTSNLLNLKLFNQRLTQAIVKNKIIIDYIEHLYSQWLDIMFLFELFLESRKESNIKKIIYSSKFGYYKDYHINSLSLEWFDLSLDKLEYDTSKVIWDTET